MISILSPIILGLITFLTLAIGHFWKDRRTKGYKKTRKILMIILPIAVVVNIYVAYSGEQHIISLQESLENLQKEVATLEQQNKTHSMLEKMHLNIIIDYEKLKRKYPKGFFLFSSSYNKVIPSSHKLLSVFTVNWENSKIQSIDDSFVYIFLKTFYHHPNDIKFENLHVLIERNTGSFAFGIVMDNTGMFIELLEDKSEELIYVIGFREIESTPKLMDPDPEVVNYIKKHNIPGVLIRIDTNVRKHLKIKGHRVGVWVI